MEKISRRDVCGLMAAVAAMGGAAGAQMVPGEAVLGQSKAYAFEKLPVKPSANGGASRAVVTGELVTGEAVEVHETTLPPGQMPHPPHKHRHSEFMMIREGTVEFDMDGVKERVGPGGVLFAASNVMHGLKNVGEKDANYFVIAIGREAAVRPV